MKTIRKFQLQTADRSVINLTQDIKAFVQECGVQSGICIVYTTHTTAGLTVTSFWDPNGFLDLQEEICRLIPTPDRFQAPARYAAGRSRACEILTAGRFACLYCGRWAAVAGPLAGNLLCRVRWPAQPRICCEGALRLTAICSGSRTTVPVWAVSVRACRGASWLHMTPQVGLGNSPRVCITRVGVTDVIDRRIVGAAPPPQHPPPGNRALRRRRAYRYPPAPTV